MQRRGRAIQATHCIDEIMNGASVTSAKLTAISNSIKGRLDEKYMAIYADGYGLAAGSDAENPGLKVLSDLREKHTQLLACYDVVVYRNPKQGETPLGPVAIVEKLGDHSGSNKARAGSD